MSQVVAMLAAYFYITAREETLPLCAAAAATDVRLHAYKSAQHEQYLILKYITTHYYRRGHFVYYWLCI